MGLNKGRFGFFCFLLLSCHLCEALEDLQLPSNEAQEKATSSLTSTGDTDSAARAPVSGPGSSLPKGDENEASKRGVSRDMGIERTPESLKALLFEERSDGSLGDSGHPLGKGSEVGANPDFNEYTLKAEETERRKTYSNPSVDEIISGIIQLIGGNVKIGRPPVKPQLQPPPLPLSPEGFYNNPSRINNRAPPKVTFIGPPGHPGHYLPNFIPPTVLIGPGPPAGLPLPLPPTKFAKPVPHGMPPSRPNLNIAENDVSVLLGMMRPQQPKDTSPSTHSTLGNRDRDGDRDRTSAVSNDVLDLTASATRLGVSETYLVPSDSISSIQSQLSSATPSLESVHVSSLSVGSISSTPLNGNSGPKSQLEPKESTAKTEATKVSKESTISSTPTVATIATTAVNEVIAREEPSLPQPPAGASGPAPPGTEIVSSFASNGAEDSMPSGPVTAWVPLYLPPGLRPTTKVWAEDPPIIITKEEPSIFDITVKHKIGAGHETQSLSSSSISGASSQILPSTVQMSPTIKPTPTARLEPKPKEVEEEIVYGKPALEANRPVAPSFSEVTISGLGVLSTSSSSSTSTSTRSATRRPTQSSSTYREPTPGLGRPIVTSVDVDEVKPLLGAAANAQPKVITEPGQGSVFIDGRPTYFKVRPNIGPTLQVGSGVTVNAGNEVANGNNNKPHHLSPRPGLGPRPVPTKAVRRPPFRPRPVVPLVRIDTCIVGDDTTCDVKLNEKCKTELGISSCQCRPGFGRITARGLCTPVSALGVSLRIDRLGENKLTFSRNYLNSNSEEYQFLEYESLQALNSLFALSRLSKVFKGVRVNKFYAVAGKMVVNATIELELNNATKSSTIRRIVQQELSRVIALRNNNVGESQLWVEASLNAVPRVEDINECSSQDMNDCSVHAKCVNEFGVFRCLCKPGYEDKFPKDPHRLGRYCASCSPQYCSNRGDCVIVAGQRECRCRGNYIGSKCDIDGEVLGVAVGGSVAALVIIIITFLCLYMWNQRWKNEQQKMEAMSAASAQTFSYVNKQQAAGYRYSASPGYALDDRMRWAQSMNETANYYVNPEQLMAAATSQQHVYATPSRVQTPDALVHEDESRYYTRPSRSKSRSSTSHGYQGPPMGPGSLYNETEFSTRETLYTPSHLIISPRNKYSVYS